MKNNASLRLAKAALTCALFGTMFTSCTKEEDILPNSQISVLTDDSREDRTKGYAVEEKQVHLQQLNNEQSRLAGTVAGEVYDGGGKLIGKRPVDKCEIVRDIRTFEFAQADQGFSVRRRNIDSNKAAQ